MPVKKKKQKPRGICDSTQVSGLNIWFYGVSFSTLGNTGGGAGLGESYRVWSWMSWVGSTKWACKLGAPGLASVAMTRHLWQRNWMRDCCQGWILGALHKESGMSLGGRRRGVTKATGKSHVKKADHVLISRKKKMGIVPLLSSQSKKQQIKIAMRYNIKDFFKA